MDALISEDPLKPAPQPPARLNTYVSRWRQYDGYRLRLARGPAVVRMPGLRPVLAGHNSVLLLGPGERPDITPLDDTAPAPVDLGIDPALLAAADCELSLVTPGTARFRVPWSGLSADGYLRWRLLDWSSDPAHRSHAARQALCRSVLMGAAVEGRRRPIPSAGGVPGSPRTRFELSLQAAELIEAHWQEGISLDQLADHFGLSPFHLLRSFRRGLGLTPHQYLLQLRLRRSFDLLERGGLRIIDIALGSGFSSHGHYSTAFRKAFGLSPFAYQRLGREDIQAAG